MHELRFRKQLSQNIHQATIAKVKYESEECLFNDSVVSRDCLVCVVVNEFGALVE
jgi:hypothetical protein